MLLGYIEFFLRHWPGQNDCLCNRKKALALGVGVLGPQEEYSTQLMPQSTVLRGVATSPIEVM